MIGRFWPLSLMLVLCSVAHLPTGGGRPGRGPRRARFLGAGRWAHRHVSEAWVSVRGACPLVERELPQRRAGEGPRLHSPSMSWYHYLACFFAGAFLANAVPHFVQGISGERFPSPFATPPGKGLSSPRHQRPAECSLRRETSRHEVSAGPSFLARAVCATGLLRLFDSRGEDVSSDSALERGSRTSLSTGIPAAERHRLRRPFPRFRASAHRSCRQSGPAPATRRCPRARRCSRASAPTVPQNQSPTRHTDAPDSR